MSERFYDAQKRLLALNVGAAILRSLNGVKRTAEQFADMHGLKKDSLNKIIAGEIAPTQEFLDAFDRHAALRLGDLYDKSVRDQFPVKDDTIDGVCITTAAESDKTDRKTFRGPEGKHFYSYRDTAMSKTSLFRPEWILEHYVHDGKNPDTPDWAFNKGHFEHQITYFIGPVNFHWITKDGKKHVRAMNTGDTNYITPFVPHTFTTREEGKGTILAVTYGGAIATDYFQDKIQQLSPGSYLKDFQSKISGIKTALSTDDLGGVLIGHHNYVTSFEGSDAVSELIGDIPHQPHPIALEYLVVGKRPEYSNIERDAERWGYNIGENSVVLKWGGNSRKLGPGDSFFIKPGVNHSFNGNSKLLVMEIQPEGSDILGELALINRYSGEKGLERVHSENTQWY